MGLRVTALLFVLLVHGIEVSLGQSCGSTQCSTDYDDSCDPDESCELYDNCKTTQSACDTTIGEPASLSVNCYDTCIKGNPIFPTIPSQCCADSILVSETISVTEGTNYLIARLYSPNEDNTDAYRHNTYCKYNVECPDSTYDLHYFMVTFDVEPPDVSSDTCLDFLRYHFTATGSPVDTDACGELDDLSAGLKTGVHSHKLTLDFRSNRINRSMNFFLSVSCIIPPPSGARKRRQVTDTQLTTEVIAPEYECTASKSLTNEIVRDPYNEPTPDSEEFLSATFPTEQLQSQRDPLRINVSRTGVVRYENKTIIIMEEGKPPRSFKRIDVFRVYNRIEGDLFFDGSAPEDRVFPGFGYIQIGGGVAKYAQTLIEPNLILNEKEEIIVREIYQELFNRQAFDTERFYFAKPERRQSARVNCSVNALAELNVRSCTPALRVASTFFLEKDSFKDVCKKESGTLKQV